MKCLKGSSVFSLLEYMPEYIGANFGNGKFNGNIRHFPSRVNLVFITFFSNISKIFLSKIFKKNRFLKPSMRLSGFLMLLGFLLPDILSHA